MKGCQPAVNKQSGGQHRKEKETDIMDNMDILIVRSQNIAQQVTEAERQNKPISEAHFPAPSSAHRNQHTVGAVEIFVEQINK